MFGKMIVASFFILFFFYFYLFSQGVNIYILAAAQRPVKSHIDIIIVPLWWRATVKLYHKHNQRISLYINVFFLFFFLNLNFLGQLLDTSLWEPNWLGINEGEAVSRANIFN